MEERFSEKDLANRNLQETLLTVREEIASLKSKCKEKESAVEQLTVQLEKERSQVEELNLQCSELASKQMQTAENARQQIETLSRQVIIWFLQR